MTTTVRRLGPDDEEAMLRAFREAFGDHDAPDPPVPVLAEGKHWWGVEQDGRLVATALDRAHDSWLGGAPVPTAGIGGVTVAPEHRGRGLLGLLLESLLAGARERGAVVSTLFATSPGIYRRLGYEVVATLDEVSLPTAALDVGGDVPVRRATEADDEAVRAVHERWAREQNGPLRRRGPLFGEPVTLRRSGATVAEGPGGEVTGYVAWDRGRGYGPEARIRVQDVVADDVASLRSLLTTISSFASVAPTTVVQTSGHDAWRRLVRTAHPTVVDSTPYSMAVLDVAALEHLTYPEAIGAVLPFRVAGVGHTLVVEGGRGTVRAQDHAEARELTPAGLALALSGAEPSSALRRLGVLHGDRGDDPAWDALLRGRAVHVRDYF